MHVSTLTQCSGVTCIHSEALRTSSRLARHERELRGHVGRRRTRCSRPAGRETRRSRERLARFRLRSHAQRCRRVSEKSSPAGPPAPKRSACTAPRSRRRAQAQRFAPVWPGSSEWPVPAGAWCGCSRRRRIDKSGGPNASAHVPLSPQYPPTSTTLFWHRRRSLGAPSKRGRAAALSKCPGAPSDRQVLGWTHER